MLIDDIRAHLLSRYPILHLVTFEDNKADSLIAALAKEDQRKIVEWNMADGMVDFTHKRSLVEYCDLAKALSIWADMELDQHILLIKDAHRALQDNPLAIARLKALALGLIQNPTRETTLVLVAHTACVPPELEKFITLFELPLPAAEDIRAIIRDQAVVFETTVNEPDLAALTLAFQGLSEHEIRHLVTRGFQQDGTIGAEDLQLVYGEKEQIIKKSGILEMIPRSESLDGIGGLERLKTWLRQKAQVLADLEAARQFGVDAPKGVMIVGMPGCGKSLTAKAAAHLFGLPLLRLDVGSLLGQYVGQSEANMRRALQQAEAISPCVLWIDELEKAFVGMGSGGGNGGSEVASRLFGYFLTWMQDKTGAVFVLATANDISSLPPELLRKGRFDEIFYVDFPGDREREAIFKIHLHKRNKLKSAINLETLALKTQGFSGADIESVVKEAIEQAFVENRGEVTTDRILSVIQDTQPLSKVMKSKIEEYQGKFRELKIKSAQ